MKQPVCQLSLVVLAAVAAPCALASPDILKCVDGNGHITLTDQPCPAGSRVSLVIADAAPAAPAMAAGATLAGPSGAAGATGAGGDELQVEHLSLPPVPRNNWRPATGKRARLPRDEATLRGAHSQLMLEENARARPADAR